MGEVNPNSALCLSAAGAEDVSEGLHFDQDLGDIGPLSVCPAFQGYD
jgi:hypothetical protein